MKKLEQQVGKSYGNFTILKDITLGRGRIVQCKCNCGVIKNVKLNALRSGATISCGCFHKEVVTKHGLYKNKLYTIYNNIINRCTDSKSIMFSRYGGRGISCEWKTVHEFIEDMEDTYKEGLQIDRIDNNGNYNKDNCRWASRKENCRNRSTNVLYKGKTITEWCEILGLDNKKIFQRIRVLKWTIEEALELRAFPGSSRKI